MDHTVLKGIEHIANSANADAHDSSLFCYIDDILIASVSEQQHKHHLCATNNRNPLELYYDKELYQDYVDKHKQKMEFIQKLVELKRQNPDTWDLIP